MRTSGYRIADEPRPGALEQLAVNPFWPFLAVMFGGTWLSWPWFVINGLAVGSPTRARSIAIVIGGFALTAILLLALFYAVGAEWLPRESLPYLVLVVVVVKLAISYWLHVLQAGTFELYVYYGGRVRSGIFVLMAAFFVRASVVPRLVETVPFLVAWLS